MFNTLRRLANRVADRVWPTLEAAGNTCLSAFETVKELVYTGISLAKGVLSMGKVAIAATKATANLGKTVLYDLPSAGIAAYYGQETERDLALKLAGDDLSYAGKQISEGAEATLDTAYAGIEAVSHGVYTLSNGIKTVGGLALTSGNALSAGYDAACVTLSGLRAAGEGTIALGITAVDTAVDLATAAYQTLPSLPAFDLHRVKSTPMMTPEIEMHSLSRPHVAVAAAAAA